MRPTTTTLIAVMTAGILAACSPETEGSAEAPAVEENAIAEVETVSPTDASAPLGGAVDPEKALVLMKQRHENMEEIGDATKAINRALKSDSPDLETIRSSAARVAQLAPQVPDWFPPGSGPDIGKTEAKAAIWEKPQDFATKAQDFEAAATAFNAAAQAGDLPAIRERFAAMGKSCKACHDPYREEH